MIQLCGWIANLLFLSTSIIMAWKVRYKGFVEVDTDMMYLWLAGELLLIIYGIGINQAPIYVNAIIALAGILYVWRNNGKGINKRRENEGSNNDAS